jgi:membrane-associated HD superfamily phosphohydrolase
MRCPDCASLRSSHLYRVGPGRLILTILAALAASSVGAAILFAVGFFVFLIGPAYGAIVAEVVLRVSGYKRGRTVEWIGVGSIVVAAAAVIGFNLMVTAAAVKASATLAPGMAAIVVPSMFSGLLWPLVGVGLAISVCFSKLRYF